MSALTRLALLSLIVACDPVDETDTINTDTDARETDDTIETDTIDTDTIETDTLDTDIPETDTVETDDTDLTPVVQSATFNATSSTDWVYVDLSTGQPVALTAEQAATSDAWHLALRRSTLRTNGGTSGSGDVVMALSDAQDNLYDADGNALPAAFDAVDATTELAALEAPAPAPARWSPDAIAPALGADWYVYNFSNGNVTENDSVGFLVRSGEGTSYARVRVTDLDFPTRSGLGIQAFTIAVDLQAAAGSTFGSSSTFSGAIGSAGGSLCYDVDTATTVACTGTAWDLEIAFVGRDFWLRTNSGDAGDGAGGALGPYAWTDLETWTSATADPVGTDVSGTYRTETSTSLFTDEGWYAYNLSGTHRLHPNFRVWLVDSDSTDNTSPIWALQVVDYYDVGGTGGHVSLRWRELSATEPVVP